MAREITQTLTLGEPASKMITLGKAGKMEYEGKLLSSLPDLVKKKLLPDQHVLSRPENP